MARKKYVPGVYNTLPGNTLVTQVVDIWATQLTVNNVGCYAQFNRNMLLPTPRYIFFQFGKLSEPELVYGSTKMGIELRHPKWRFLPTGSRLAGGNACNPQGNRWRLVLNRFDPLLDMECCIGWGASLLLPLTWKIISPPVVFRSLIEPLPVPACTS